ncbi:prolipoprotein diacylglyceryl transferase [Deltaproteobacteria bacterium OttesenSCG-928-M10]|nr:prolipoprotein diacylglyceryl transferase [Deltaproteobacteria bacterium OttesenSCG-928-M10]
MSYNHGRPAVGGPLYRAMPWYGLSYIAAVAATWMAARRRPPPDLDGLGRARVRTDELLAVALAGALLGGRLGYILLYEPGFYLNHPPEIFRLWRGGMSFHGGLAGVIAAVLLRVSAGARLATLDYLARLAPISLGLGRVGNFLGGELWGQLSSLPWALVFPEAGPWPRHPTQLYEALWEGPVLWLILRRVRGRPGLASAVFLIFYSLGRLAVEFLRVPDPSWGYLAGGWLTWGQVLTFITLVIGLGLWRGVRK